MHFASFGSLFLVAFFAISFGYFIIFPAASPLSDHFGLIAIEIFLVLVSAAFLRLRRLRFEDFFLLNATTGRFLLATIPTAICAILLLNELDLAWRAYLADFDLRLSPSQQRSVLDIQIFQGWRQWAGGLAAVAFFPAICEELFFRGFIFTNLFGRYGAKFALGGSALFFGMAHLDFLQLPIFFLLGLFLALLAYWSHSIYPAILAHLLNNLVSLADVNLNLYGLSPIGSSSHLPWPILILLILGLVWGLRFLRRLPSVMPLIPSLPTQVDFVEEHAPQ